MMMVVKRWRDCGFTFLSSSLLSLWMWLRGGDCCEDERGNTQDDGLCSQLEFSGLSCGQSLVLWLDRIKGRKKQLGLRKDPRPERPAGLRWTQHWLIFVSKIPDFYILIIITSSCVYDHLAFRLKKILPAELLFPLKNKGQCCEVWVSLSLCDYYELSVKKNPNSS